MNYYLNPVIKQLIIPNGEWEVVYKTKEDEFFEDVIYFAVCDMIAKPCLDGQDRYYDVSEEESFLGVILPIIYNEDEGLTPETALGFEPPSSQEVSLRRKIGEVER